MESIYKKEDKQLIFKLEEDIDECTVQKIRRKLDNEIERYMPKEVIFDFNNVSFMDSAGIGLIMGRYKLVTMLGGKVQVANMGQPVRKIFQMSGMQKIIPETQKGIRSLFTEKKTRSLFKQGGKIDENIIYGNTRFC